MKRCFVLILAVSLSLFCTSCGGGEDASQSAQPATPSISSASPQTEASPAAELPAVSDDAVQPSEGSIPAAPTSTPEESRSPQPAASASKEKAEKDPAASPQPDPPPASPSSVDLDLTVLSSTMVYAEVFNMMSNPNDYIGKTVRVKGLFSIYQEPETQKVYCGVIVQDATACCAQGFDVVMPDDSRYPDDYPPAQSEVTVVGTIEADRTLEEYGILVLRLGNVRFEDSP